MRHHFLIDLSCDQKILKIWVKICFEISIFLLYISSILLLEYYFTSLVDEIIIIKKPTHGEQITTSKQPINLKHQNPLLRNFTLLLFGKEQTRSFNRGHELGPSTEEEKKGEENTPSV